MRRLLALVLLLGGCLDDEARPLAAFLEDPRYREGLPDAAGPGGGAPDARAPHRCTGVFEPRRLLRFENRTARPLELFRVEPDCSEKPVATLLPGMPHEQVSFTDQVWRLRTESGELVFEIRVGIDTPDDVVLEAP